ncbi:MAG TPA: hypothetical protein VK750_06570 [Cytophagaceae bacterium]|jgi:hypothetical protein|nr:hypothetical protein [Cytophagaceae bacterium]
MIRASALFIVIVISFLLASITSGIVYYTFYYKVQLANHAVYHRLVHNLNSGIAYTLSLAETSSAYQKQIDLYNEGSDSVKIDAKLWGIFNIASVEAYGKGIALKKAFMYGYAPSKESNVAIYLKNSDKGLRISGNTTIVGTCYLPQGTVKAANVDGFTYQGPSKLINGEIRQSPDSNIRLNSSVLSHIEELLKYDFLNFPDHFSSSPNESSEKDSLIRSFTDSTWYISYADARLTDCMYLQGNIVLYSDQPIRLRNTLSVKDIIIVAPSIIFSGKYQGTLQAFCTDSIVVDSDVTLDYPSTLVLFKKNVVNASAKIHLKERSAVSGIVCAYSTLTNDDHIHVQVNKGALVKGQLYSSGSIDCQGTIYGGMICKTTLLKTNTSINENYLLNTTIDLTKRSTYFVGSNLLPANSKKKVIKYL